MADRDSDLLRVDWGSFIHRDHLAHTMAAEVAVDWCVRRLADETGPVRTSVLLDEIQEAGIHTVGLNHHLLKSRLSQRLEIHKLCKSLTNGGYARCLSRG